MELYPGASAEAIGNLLIFPFIVSFFLLLSLVNFVCKS